MKRILAVLTVFVLTLTLFVGCGDAATEESAADNASTPSTSTDDTPSAGGDDESSDAGTTQGSTDGLSGSISTNGSTSMESVIGSLIESFTGQNPDVTMTYDPTGSGSGITAVAEGTADIGLASRALKDSEIEQGLEGITIALDGIAIIVNNENTVEDLTIEQIAGLANGTIQNWSEIGGPDSPVVMIGREPGSGTRDGFESIMGVEDECVYEQELTSTGAVITAVQSNPNAIGYASLSSVSDVIKVVSVEGVSPSEDTVLDGSYQVQRPFVFVIKSGETLSAEVQAFIDYTLSDAATDIISGAGAVQAK